MQAELPYSLGMKPVHAAFAQNLRAHAVSAQVHAAALRGLGRAGRALKLGQHLRRTFTAVEQHGHALACLCQVLQAGVQTPRVHGAVDFERVEH